MWKRKRKLINLIVEKETLSLVIIRKIPSFHVYTNFNSFIPETYKTHLIKSLLLHCFNLSSDFVKFLHVMNILKSILSKNNYLCDFLDKFVIELLERALTVKVVISTVPKKDLMIVLLYLGKLSLQITLELVL